MRLYGINQVRDECYAVAAVLTYWAFKCRDRAKSPAMGTKTWTFLETSIQNAATSATTIEDYLQRLTDKLASHLRPNELTRIIQPEQRILRVKRDGQEIQERSDDRDLAWMGWHDLLEDIAPAGYTEWDVLELCRTKSAIIQVLCRLRFEEDRALGADEPVEVIEVEATHV